MKNCNNLGAGFGFQTQLFLKCLLVLILIVSSIRRAYPQMEILIVLDTVRRGTAIIERYNLEQPQKVFECSFINDSLRMVLNYSDSILNKNEVFRYSLNFYDGEFSQSHFMGSPGLLAIDFKGPSPIYKLEKSNPLYPLAVESDNYDGSPEAKSRIINILRHFVHAGTALNYLYYIVYSTYTANMLSSNEAKDIISFSNPNYTNYYWLNKLKQQLDMMDFFETALKNDDFGFTQERFVLLKFWASWCKPCLEDDKILKSRRSFLRKKSVKVVPLNIQEKTALLKGREQHSLDIQSFIHKYAVTSLPRYILLRKGTEVLDVQDLNIVLEYLK